MENCLFCKIIAGDIPSAKVYEDEYCYAFRDINPQAPTHVLVVPKEHVPDIAHMGELAPDVQVALLAAIGFTCSCIFTIIFSAAMQARPEKTNEISGLMITGIVGGAIIQPLMGFATDKIGSQMGSLLVIGLCMAYLVLCAVRLLGKKSKAA